LESVQGRLLQSHSRCQLLHRRCYAPTLPRKNSRSSLNRGTTSPPSNRLQYRDDDNPLDYATSRDIIIDNFYSAWKMIEGLVLWMSVCQYRCAILRANNRPCHWLWINDEEQYIRPPANVTVNFGPFNSELFTLQAFNPRLIEGPMEVENEED
jgi:hypothetical protein